MAITANTTANANGSPITFTNLASGLDTASIVQKLVQIKSVTLNSLNTKKTALTDKQTAYNTLAAKMGTLQSAAGFLGKNTTFKNSVAASVDQSSVLSATAASGSLLASYNVTVLNRSSATRLTSGAAISSGSGMDTTAVLNGASGLATTLSSATGSFTINGTAINYDASKDTLTDIVARINGSGAGVNAMYDKLADKMILTNRTNGATGISVADVTGNLGAALNMTVSGGANDGVSVTGANARITIDGINNGNPIQSNDDLFTEAETGIQGLSLTLKQDTGSTHVNVGADPAPIVSAVNSFVTAYNDLQDFIATESEYAIGKPQPTDGSKNTDGHFAGDQSVQDLGSTLRSMVAKQFNGLSGPFSYLSGVGISTSGVDPDLTVDSTKLANALTTNLAGVQKLFADPAAGTFARLQTYVQKQATFPQGLIQSKTNSLTDQINLLSTSIDREKQNVDSYSQTITRQFATMETTISAYGSGLNQLLSTLPNGKSN